MVLFCTVDLVLQCLISSLQVVRWAVPNLAKMTKLGFLRLSYEKQDTLLKLLILSMAAVLCESTTSYMQQYCIVSQILKTNITPTMFLLSSILHQAVFRLEVWKCHPWVWSVSAAWVIVISSDSFLLRFRSHFHLSLTFRYFNYRTTRFLAEEGFYKFHNWFDDRAWYPLGRIIGGTIYPGRERTVQLNRTFFYVFFIIIIIWS